MFSARARYFCTGLADVPVSGATRFVCAWTRIRDAAISGGTGNGNAGPNGVLAPDRWLLFFALAFTLGFSGCTSGSNVKAGPISVTDPSGTTSGQLSSLGAGSIVEVSMTPVGDTTNAGVNWAVTCGGSPVTGSVTGGACGTLVPTHTPDGVASVYTAPSVIPIGKTVTITGAVASNPAAVSSVTLPVVPQPVSLSFISPPSTIDLGAKIVLQVRLVNGTAADSVQWTASCGSTPCGLFASSSSNGEFAHYTAPTSMPASGNTIQVTASLASDSTVSASTSLTIVPVSISVTPTAYNVQTGGTAKFTATLTNDVLAQGANWSVSCSSGNCGQLRFTHRVERLRRILRPRPCQRVQ